MRILSHIALIILIFFGLLVQEDPAKKTNYQIVSTINGSYAVLSEYEGEFLIVNFDENYIESGDINLHTDNYSFIDMNNANLKYKKYKKVLINGEYKD